MDENLVMILILGYMALICIMSFYFGVKGVIALILVTFGWLYFTHHPTYTISYPEEFKFFIVNGEPIHYQKTYTAYNNEKVDIAYYRYDDFTELDLVTDKEGRKWQVIVNTKIENYNNPHPVEDAQKVLTKWIQSKASSMTSVDFYEWGYYVQRSEINAYMTGKVKGIKSSDYMLSMIYCTSDPQYNMDITDDITDKQKS